MKFFTGVYFRELKGHSRNSQKFLTLKYLVSWQHFVGNLDWDIWSGICCIRFGGDAIRTKK